MCCIADPYADMLVCCWLLNILIYCISMWFCCTVYAHLNHPRIARSWLTNASVTQSMLKAPTNAYLLIGKIFSLPSISSLKTVTAECRRICFSISVCLIQKSSQWFVQSTNCSPAMCLTRKRESHDSMQCLRAGLLAVQGCCAKLLLWCRT